MSFDESKLRSFVYIAEDKVSSLYSQLPRSRSTVRSSIGIGQTKIETSENDAEYSLEQKLAKVLSLLFAKGEIGPPARPQQFIYGSGEFCWGPYLDVYSREATGMVLFGGEVDEITIALAGSSHNVVGTHGADETHSYSLTPIIFRELRGVVELSEQAIRTGSQRALPSRHDSDELLHASRLAVDQMTGPSERCEFVARVLRQSTNDGSPTILATPLFVALA